MEPSFRPGDQANDEGADRECHEVARRRTGEWCEAGCTSGEDGHAGGPDCQVGEDASAPSRAPNSNPQSMTPSVCSVTGTLLPNR